MAMHLVMLAAGFGTRFGGLKQLAPVGPNGEAIMDYTATSAALSGIERVILIVRPEIEDVIRTHIEEFWPKALDVRYAYQPEVSGTAPAVMASASHVDQIF